MKHIFLKSGFFRTSNKNEKAGDEISFTNLLRRTLKYLGIPYVDPCCDVPENVPISFNTKSGVIEKWNSTTGTYDSLNSNSIASFIPIGAQQTLTGAGAVNITSYVTNLVSTGAAQAITLADGNVIGLRKFIKHYTAGGSMVLTPANLANGTTITFTTVGEVAELIWDGTEWIVVALLNHSGTTLPVLA